ncbi:MAG: glycerol-3-phosphate dehydrogenase/oxidase [Flavobacteriales bacterium]|nr:glycerol-3-phosphate dehydrogenase/oxidase [Flavobacteriales bacterium]
MFSSKNRSEIITKLQKETFDILVIGGGITGVGIALDAAGRGLKVALVEKQDFAAGTSSRSTKLIHGGLRYLKQLEFGLVREVGHERKTVYHNAPHLVIPEKMLLPITDGGSFGKASASVGIYTYDWLAGVKRSERRTVLDRKETIKREPLLKKSGLEAGVVYWEYRSDDARLVIEVAKTATEDGAVLLSYCEFEAFSYSQKHISGAKVKDLRSGNTYEIKAKRTINAAGPWVDAVRSKDEAVKGKRLHLTKGIHLVFDHARFPLRQAVYFDVPDGRMIFAIPRDGATYVGTTDTNYTDKIERPQVFQEDVDYVLQATNNAFDIEPLTQADIQSTWAGLRPLIHEDGKSPSELSRKDEIFLSEHGLISIAGGKLTGYRKMAERTVDLAFRQLEVEEKRSFALSRSSNRKLSGGLFHSFKAFVAELGETQLTEAQLNGLFHKYGSNAQGIIAKIDLKLEDRTLAILLSELRYCVDNEMIYELSDFLIRRTGRLYFEKPLADKYALALNQELTNLLTLSEADSKASLQTYLNESKAVLDFSTK